MVPLVRRLILCACAAAGFAGMAALLHRAAPLRVPVVTPKLNYLEARGDGIDTVLIGSSRIYHGVSPKAFDAATAAAGKPTHSFNLAVDGMMPPESLQMARTLLAMRLPRLRRLFLEVAGTRGVPELNTLTVRDIYWQDLNALDYDFRLAPVDYHAVKGKHRWPKAWYDVSAGALLFARNQFNIGRLIPATDSMPEPRATDTALGPDQDGYLPELLPISPPQQARLDKELEAVRNGTATARPKSPFETESYELLRELASRRGVELVLMAPPVTTRDFNAKQDAPPGVRLLAFDDPGRHPELYTAEHRFDYDHLNGAGALIFSRELAEAYLAGQ